MKIIYEKKTVIFTTVEERDVFSVLFNQGLIRGAYIFWTNRGRQYSHDCPPEWIKEYEPTGYMILTELEDPASKSAFKKEMEAKEIEKVNNANKELASDLFKDLGLK